MTLADLRTAHPEFTYTPDYVVQTAIDDAVAHMDETAWGDEYNTGLMLLACHNLAMTSYGEASGLADENRSSIYFQDWARLARIVGSVWRTT